MYVSKIESEKRKRKNKAENSDLPPCKHLCQHRFWQLSSPATKKTHINYRTNMLYIQVIRFINEGVATSEKK